MVARLRALLPRDAIVYAVRRAADREFGWLVCDLYCIDGPEVVCITAEIAHALGCHEPGREVGVKLRHGVACDPLTQAIDLRLSTLLFGAPEALRHRMLDYGRPACRRLLCGRALCGVRCAHKYRFAVNEPPGNPHAASHRRRRACCRLCRRLLRTGPRMPRTRLRRRFAWPRSLPARPTRSCVTCISMSAPPLR